MDFKRATALFADPAFDGEPVQIYEPGPDDPPLPPEEVPYDSEEQPPSLTTGEPPAARTVTYVVDDVEVRVATERVQYLDGNGRLITESLKDYTRKAVRKEYASVDDFLRRWTGAERKKAVIDELEAQGVLSHRLPRH